MDIQDYLGFVEMKGDERWDFMFLNNLFLLGRLEM